jgi:alkaline phosphatase
MRIKSGIFGSIVLGLVALSIAFGVGFAGRGTVLKDNKDKSEHPPIDLACKPNPKHLPKNVIIFIADGGGFNHYRAADYYECNQVPCRPYEDFPVRLAASTYPSGGEYNAKVAWCSFDYVENSETDSAAAATAMATGVKSYNAAIGVDVNGSPVLNLLERAEQLGKATGVVTSVPFSHATPAGFVAHNGDRNNYTQIASDMIEKSAADVVMGAGHPLYNADGKLKGTSNYSYIGADVWTRLKAGTAGGDANGDGVADHWTLVQTRSQFQALAKGKTPKRVFGIAQVFETLQERRSGDVYAEPYKAPSTQTVPTLEEMTIAALNVLDEDPNGFFVMIEGGAVDWAAHANYSGRLIEEMNDFNHSIDAVIDWVHHKSNWGETLIIITADHETGHLTGPGSGQMPEGPVWNELVGNGIGNLPAMEWHSGSHTNSLVPFFAKGRGAQSFGDTIDGYDAVRGPYIDNTDIANVIFTLWHTN